MDHQSIISKIREFDADGVRAALNEAPESSRGESKEQVISDTMSWLDALQGDLAMLVKQVGDGEDVELVLAIQYVEMKSRWIAFNTKMNYSLFRGNAPFLSDMCRATGVSMFLQHIETLLRPQDIEHITEFLAQPLNEAA